MDAHEIDIFDVILWGIKQLDLQSDVVDFLEILMNMKKFCTLGTEDEALRVPIIKEIMRGIKQLDPQSDVVDFLDILMNIEKFCTLETEDEALRVSIIKEIFGNKLFKPTFERAMEDPTTWGDLAECAKGLGSIVNLMVPEAVKGPPKD